jgi:hypothetical protein
MCLLSSFDEVWERRGKESADRVITSANYSKIGGNVSGNLLYSRVIIVSNM